MSLKKAVACVRKYKNFLITAHTNLEGDALGAELAFAGLLKKLGKATVIINEDAVPAEYDFLPGKEKIRRFSPRLKNLKFDCFAALDCSDLKRTGEVYRMNLPERCVLNIDHHISNQHFGDVNWVEPSASSCCEMIYKLYKEIGVPLDRESNLALYTGIVADTGSFRYSNTSSLTHRIAAELLKDGLNVTMVYKSIYENVPFEDMRLLTKILPRMRRCAGGRVVWFELERKEMEKRRLSFDLSEHILGFGRAIKGVEVVALFKENLGVKDEIRFNLRSNGAVDVNKIASFFGGGGHKAASGCTIRGRLKAIRSRVLAKIEESLRL